MPDPELHQQSICLSQRFYKVDIILSDLTGDNSVSS